MTDGPPHYRSDHKAGEAGGKGGERSVWEGRGRKGSIKEQEIKMQERKRRERIIDRGVGGIFKESLGDRNMRIQIEKRERRETTKERRRR